MSLTHWLSRLASQTERRPTRRRKTLRTAPAESQTLEQRIVPTTIITEPIVAGGTITAADEASVTIAGSTDASTLRLTVTDTNGTTADIVVDATVSSGTFSATVDVRGLADGVLTVTADENVGAAGEDLGADTATVNLDSNTPTINLGADTDLSGSISLSEITAAGGDLVVTGVADANSSVTVSLTSSGGANPPVEIVTAGADGSYTATFDLDTDGTAGVDAGFEGNLTVTATQGAETVSATTVIALDVSVATPTVGIDAGGDILVDATERSAVTISGTAEANSSVQLTIMSVGGGAPVVINTTADAEGNYSAIADLTNLFDGILFVTAASTDASGNPSTNGTAIGFLDATTALPTISAPVLDDGFLSTGDLTDVDITGTAEAGASVLVTVTDAGGTVLATQTVTATGGQFSVNDLDLSAAAQGELTVTAVATDFLGNVSSEATLSGVVDTLITAPTLNVSAFLDNLLTQAESASVDVTGTAEADSSVRIVITDAGANVLVDETVTADSSGNFSLTGLDLSDAVQGLATITATATDTAGNVSTETSLSAVVDTLVSAPTLNVPAFLDNVLTEAEAASVTVTGTTDPNASVQIVITDAGSNVLVDQTVTADASGNFSLAGLDLTDAVEGEITITATATDTAGNVSTETSLSAVVDALVTTPTLNVGSFLDSILTEAEAANVTVTGTADPNASVRILISDAASNVLVDQTVTADENGNFSLAGLNLSNAVEGLVTITATATDASGNVSEAATASAVFALDDGGPGPGEGDEGGGTIKLKIRRDELKISGHRNGSANIEIVQTAEGVFIRGINGTTLTLDGRTLSSDGENIGNIRKISGRLGNADDRVTIRQEGTASLDPIDVNLNLGKGDNVLTITNMNLADLDVSAGDGNDQINVEGVTVNDDVSVRLGHGTNRVSAVDAVFASLKVTGGNDSDIFDVEDVTVNGVTSVDTKGGSDSMDVVDSTLSGEVKLKARDSLQVTVDGDSDININLDRLDDDVFIDFLSNPI